MKPLNRLIVSVLTSVLVVAMWTLPAWGQGGNPPASTKESGQTSGKGQTAAEQTNTSAEKTLTGCLSGPNQGGVFVLTNQQYKNGVEVGGAQGVNLKSHVGNEVKLTGMWASSGAAMGEREKVSQEQKGERHFKATKLEHIASSCTEKSK